MKILQILKILCQEVNRVPCELLAKVRRLYDIANVLTSLNLIKKVHVREERGRKPAFRWLGPVEFSGIGNAREKPETVHIAPGERRAFLISALCAEAPAKHPQPASQQDARKLKLCRHSSFNTAPSAAAVERQVSSAPCSPRCAPRSKKQIRLRLNRIVFEV